MTDGDAPKLTLERYAEIAALAQKRRSEKVRPIISLHISPETLDISRSHRNDVSYHIHFLSSTAPIPWILLVSLIVAAAIFSFYITCPTLFLFLSTS